MAFRFHITTPPLKWSGRKASMMMHDIRMLLAREGCPNAKVEIEHLDKAQEGEVRKYLHLTCEQCLVEWYPEVMSPCPQCGERAHVLKLQPDRVALPSENQIAPKDAGSTKTARTKTKKDEASSAA